MKSGQSYRKIIKISLSVIVMCSAFFFSGCASQQVWTQKGLNQEEFDRDLARCDREVSSSTQIVGYADSTDLERGLERNIMKDNLIKKCMYSKGYKLEKK